MRVVSVDSYAFRTEFVLFLWGMVADYLNEQDYLAICHCFELTAHLTNVGTGQDANRLSNFHEITIESRTRT
jgi:hypothetical protein